MMTPQEHKERLISNFRRNSIAVLKYRRMTRSELAKQLGLTRSNVTDTLSERNERTNITIETLTRYARGLNVDQVMNPESMLMEPNEFFREYQRLLKRYPISDA